MIGPILACLIRACYDFRLLIKGTMLVTSASQDMTNLL